MRPTATSKTSQEVIFKHQMGQNKNFAAEKSWPTHSYSTDLRKHICLVQILEKKSHY